MYKSLAVAAATVVAITGGAVAAAPVPVPGPKPPTEHVAISGGFFKHESGNPGCYSSGGSAAAAFPVPSGVVVTGATVYVVDSFATGGVTAMLRRHDLTTGGTYELKRASTSGAPGDTTIELDVPGGFLVTSGQAINISAYVGPAMCLKGAEVHFVRDAGGTPNLKPGQAPTTAVAPDGGPEQAIR